MQLMLSNTTADLYSIFHKKETATFGVTASLTQNTQ